MSSLPDQIIHAPMPLLVLDNGDMIVQQNLAALALGFTTGDPMSAYVEGLQEPFRDAVRREHAATSYLLRLNQREKWFTIHARESEAGLLLWLQDISGQLALAEQVRQLKNPGTKSLRKINHVVVTALGFSELLEVIMADNRALSATKLKAARQYQTKVLESLKQIQQLTDRRSPTGDPRGKKSILVADGHQALTDLITELLRIEGYETTGFSDAGSVLKYCAVNGHGIHKAVIDDCLKNENGQLLVTALQKLMPDLDIVTLSSDLNVANRGGIRKPLDFRALLQAVED